MWAISASSPCRPRPAAPAPRPGRSTLAGAAGVLGADRAQNPQSRRRPVERLADLFADPMHLTEQHGHSVDAGSITCSQRGRCAGRAPMLRRALARFCGAVASRWPCRRWRRRRRRRRCGQIERQLLGAGFRRRFRARAEDQSFNVMICARKLSFSPSKARIISTARRDRRGDLPGESPYGEATREPP